MSRRNIQRPIYTDGDVRGKNKWSPDEDNLLRDLVIRLGTGNWSLLAASLVPRTGKQCRERWFNHLADDVKKGDWTEEEDDTLLAMQKIYGNQWAKITQKLYGRTDNAIKNRWHGLMRAGKALDPGYQLNLDDEGDTQGDLNPEAKFSLESCSPSGSRNIKTVGKDILKRKRSHDVNGEIEDNATTYIPAENAFGTTVSRQIVNRKPPKKRFHREESEKEGNYVQAYTAEHEDEEDLDEDSIYEQLIKMKSETIEKLAYPSMVNEDVNSTDNGTQKPVHVEGRSIYSMRKDRSRF